MYRRSLAKIVPDTGFGAFDTAGFSAPSGIACLNRQKLRGLSGTRLRRIYF